MGFKMARKRFETKEMLELENAARQIMIDKTGKKYAEDFELRCSYFIVEFDDAFVAIEIGPEDNISKDLVPFGRSSNHRDEFEVMPAVIIPQSHFKLIQTKLI